jgi:hypothetical protein
MSPVQSPTTTRSRTQPLGAFGGPAPGSTYPRPRPGYRSKLTLLPTRFMFIEEGRILPESEVNTCDPSS